MLIGITGYAGSGKDEVARHLVERWGYRRYGLADPIREALLKLNPGIPLGDALEPVKLAYLVKHWGWDYAKREYPEVRRLLQVLGTEVGREMLGPNVWLDVAFARLNLDDAPRVVIPDIRFHNEAAWVYEQGGRVLQVDRPGVGPLNGHASEGGLPRDGVEDLLLNDGTLEDLHTRIDRAMARLRITRPVTA